MSQLVGPGAAVEAGATSAFFLTPFPHKPGDKARDNEGNEFLFVDFTANVYYGTLVQINCKYEATPLLGTAATAFRVGVVCSGLASTVSNEHPTSDHGGWVQVYGVHPAVQTHTASDGGVSANAGGQYWCIPQTSVGTPSGTMSLQVQGTGAGQTSQTSNGGNVIYGMWVVNMGECSDLTTYPGASGASGPCSVSADGATSGTGTSAFSGQTYAVFLNYPYVNGVTVALTDDTSQ